MDLESSARLCLARTVATVVVAAGLCVPAPLPAQKSVATASPLEALVRDAESAAGLFSNGRLLYNADTYKEEWGQYCRNSLALADRGEFRLAVREASKALFLGQNSSDATALTYASRDLANAYSLAGDLDKAEKWAKQSLTHLSRSGVRNRADILVPVHKVLGDVALRQNDFGSALKHYQTALSEARLTERLPIRLSIANAESGRGRLEAARAILSDIGAGDPPWVPYVSRANGQLALAERNYGKAVEYFSTAIAGVRGEKDSYHLIWMQYGLGQALAAAGERDKAISAMSKESGWRSNCARRFAVRSSARDSLETCSPSTTMRSVCWSMQNDLMKLSD